MARYVFRPEVVLREGPATTFNTVTSPAALLYASAPFTVHSDRTGGTDYSADLTALDGVSAFTPVTDSDGQIPWFRGPDGVKTVYIDAGSGTRFPSHAVDVTTDLLNNAASLAAAQTWTGDQDFTGLVDFTSTPTVNGVPLGTGGGGGGGSLTSYSEVQALPGYPAVLAAGPDQATARAAIGAGTSSVALGTVAGTAAAANNVGTLMAQVTNLVAFLNATGQPYIVYVNPTTGVWPNSGQRVHASGATMTGFTGRWIWDSQAKAGVAKPTGMIDGDFWDDRVA